MLYRKTHYLALLKHGRDRPEGLRMGGRRGEATYELYRRLLGKFGIQSCTVRNELWYVSEGWNKTPFRSPESPGVRGRVEPKED